NQKYRSLSASQGNPNIFENQGQTFIDAARNNNIDVSYLVAHAMWETGYGRSALAQGIELSEFRGTVLENPVMVYNFYGIGAIDGSAISSGAEASYANGFTTIENTITGSAKWIASNYIHSSKYKQDSVYKMKWNYDYTWHQYATDVNWANGIAKIMTRLNTYYDNPYILGYEFLNYKK
ncbi:MAG: glucosaminidase domain-containing protein, partial [Peptostreptococcaceae bacterium]